MSLIFPNKHSGITTDGIYADVMAPVEDGMDMFYLKNTKTKVEGVEDLKTANKGLVALLESFGSRPDENTNLRIQMDSQGGLESIGAHAKQVFSTIINIAKDIASWIMSIINNKLVRLDNRQFRVASRRKRHGLVTKPVKYPANVRRLVIPNKVTEDGTWIPDAISIVEKFYKDGVNTYKGLSEAVRVPPSEFDPVRSISDVNDIVTRTFGMSKQSNSPDGSTINGTNTLPGNRNFMYIAPKVIGGPIGMYFDDPGSEVKLKSPTFQITSFTADKTLSSVKSLLDTIRNNQKTVSDLHRNLEKEIERFTAETKLTPEHREYLLWIIKLSKRMSTVTIQYVTSVIGAGLDFVQAGINE